MPAPVIQPAFASGELAPALYGRVDLAKWHSGAALLRNFFVDARGGVMNRAGLRFVGPSYFSETARLIPFQFSTEQTYMLVFSDHKMHVVMNGAFVVEPPGSSVTSSPTNPFQMDRIGGPVFVAGDWIYVDPSLGVGSMARFAGRIFEIITATPLPFVRYTLRDPATDEVVDGTPYGGGAGGIKRVYTLATPWADADLALLKFTQDADTMTLCHPNYPTQILTRTDHSVWTVTPASFAPTLPPPSFPAATSSDPTGTTTYRYVITSVGGNGVSESLPSTVAQVNNSKAMSATPGVRVTVAWVYNPADNPQLFNIYRQSEVRDGAPDPTQIYGFVGTVKVDGSAAGRFVDQNIAPDFSQSPPIDPGVLSSVDNYPACTNYYQQRQCFAGSNNQPNTINASKTGDFFNMQFSSPSRPNDAIVVTLVAQQVNAVKHLVAMDALLAFTSNAAWKIDGGANGGPLQPGQIDANPQAYNGCSDVPPIIVGRDVLYVQAMGSSVRDLAYNDFVKIYTGQDMSVLSAHLFQGRRIVEWAYAEEPHKVIWCVRDDGVLLAFTYLKEQDVYAWSHCVTNGQVKSVAVIQEGDEHAVYVVVQRKLHGVYVKYVERMASRLLGDNPELGIAPDFTRFFFVDAGLSTTLMYPAANLAPNNGELQEDGRWWVQPHLWDATVTVPGAGYTAPVATIEDPTGTGGVIVLTVIAGAITAAIVTARGQNYTRPVVRITDSTGAGAVVHVGIVREMELLADSPVFALTAVGQLYVGNGGYGDVISVNSTRSISVDMRAPLANDFLVPAGRWSVTPKVSSVRGLDHLEGREVAVLADGNVIENRTVTDGEIALEQPAASVMVGLPYVSRMESLYCDFPGQMVQGRRKRIPSVIVRTAASRGLKCGVKGHDLEEFKERDDTSLMGDPIACFTGDRQVLTPGGYDRAAQVVVEQQFPLPAMVLALMPDLTVGDTPSS